MECFGRAIVHDIVNAFVLIPRPLGNSRRVVSTYPMNLCAKTAPSSRVASLIMFLLRLGGVLMVFTLLCVNDYWLLIGYGAVASCKFNDDVEVDEKQPRY
jgi:hypothetical protein